MFYTYPSTLHHAAVVHTNQQILCSQVSSLVEVRYKHAAYIGS